MKTPSIKLFSIVALVLVTVFLFSGCVSNTPDQPDPAPAPAPTYGADDSTNGAQLADDMTEGTGSGPNDISGEDLDGLQSDLDELDEEVDGASESNI